MARFHRECSFSIGVITDLVVIQIIYFLALRQIIIGTCMLKGEIVTLRKQLSEKCLRNK